MDDKNFLIEFELDGEYAHKRILNLELMNLPLSPKKDCSVFIFTNSENARTFFLNPEYSGFFSPTNYFIFQNEGAVPSSHLQKGDKVYLLSISGSNPPVFAPDEGPPWLSALCIALIRIFIFDRWYCLKSDQFRFPRIIVDNNDAAKLVHYFCTVILQKYIDLAEIINSQRSDIQGKRKNILIYNTGDAEILPSLYEYLKNGGKEVFLIRNRFGWVPDEGRRSQDDHFMNDVDFAKYLIVNNIQYVVFNNFFDMQLFNVKEANKIWIMMELGVTGISLTIDTMIEFPHLRFRYLHWLPDNIKVISASSTESYDAFSNWMDDENVHKCPQLIAYSKSTFCDSQSDKVYPEELMVASHARLFQLKVIPDLVLFLVPLAREIALSHINIYTAYFLLVDAVLKAEKVLYTDKLVSFYGFIAQITIILRSLLRFYLVDAAAKATKKNNISFKIYGSKDWEILFPEQYIPEFLSLEELHKAYLRDIVLIPTPSTSFESQHPSITKVMILGGKVIAPAPVFNTEDMTISSLERFYFNELSEMEVTLMNALEKASPTQSEKDLLLDRFGVPCLGAILEGIMEGENNRNCDIILGAQEAMLLMCPNDLKTISSFSEYIIMLFESKFNNRQADFLLSNVSERCSQFMLKEIDAIITSKADYIEKLEREGDIQGRVLKEIY